jgi:hypothetical protein
MLPKCRTREAQPPASNARFVWRVWFEIPIQRCRGRGGLPLIFCSPLSVYTMVLSTILRDAHHKRRSPLGCMLTSMGYHPCLFRWAVTNCYSMIFTGLHNMLRRLVLPCGKPMTEQTSSPELANGCFAHAYGKGFDTNGWQRHTFWQFHILTGCRRRSWRGAQRVGNHFSEFAQTGHAEILSRMSDANQSSYEKMKMSVNRRLGLTKNPGESVRPACYPLFFPSNFKTFDSSRWTPSDPTCLSPISAPFLMILTIAMA